MRLRYYGIPWIRPKVDEPVKKFFMKFGKLRNYKKGENIFVGKEFYPYLSLLINGMVQKYCAHFQLQNTSKDKAISIILPYSMIGDTFFMSNRGCYVSTTVMRDSVLLEVPHDTVWEYMFSNNSFNKTMIYNLMYDMESDLEGFANIVARTPRDRLLCLFKGLVVRCEAEEENGWYKIPVKLTHYEIAQVIYTTPLTINRILLDMKNEGYYKNENRCRYISKDLLDRLYDWIESDRNDEKVIGKPVLKCV